jgi:tRNA A-37 threonylcarbamoyl transferase component Bud32
VLQPFVSAVDAILAAGTTLHAWAGAQPGARRLGGRATAYAVTLGDTPVVVRHSQHGGLLAPITNDLFLAPTRAPHELNVSMRLRAAGVPTPEIVAHATYDVLPGLQRADVVTREIAGREPVSVAEAEGLLEQLARAGAVHPDLNMRNVLVAGATTYVLDVDRVYFLAPDDRRVDQMNRARLARSAAKLGRA